MAARPEIRGGSAIASSPILSSASACPLALRPVLDGHGPAERAVRPGDGLAGDGEGPSAGGIGPGAPGCAHPRPSRPPALAHSRPGHNSEQRAQLDALLMPARAAGPAHSTGCAMVRIGAAALNCPAPSAGSTRCGVDSGPADHRPCAARPGTALARFATVAKAQAVARMPLERRTATLLAFVRTLEATAQDDVLDLFDIVVSTLFTDAAKVGKKARLRTIRDLDAAALQLRRAGGVLMDEAVEDDAVREAAFALVPRTHWRQRWSRSTPSSDRPAISILPNCAPKPASYVSCRPCCGPSRSARRRPVSRSNGCGAPLRSTDGRGPASSAPVGFVPSGWKRQVRAPDGGVDSLGYRLCLLDAMRAGIRRRDLGRSVLMSGIRRPAPDTQHDPRQIAIRGCRSSTRSYRDNASSRYRRRR